MSGLTRDDALALDAADPVGFARDRFAMPADTIYLDGNSLGPLPRATPARLAGVVEREWGRDLIAGWNRHDWIGQSQRLGDAIAPLVGAQAGEIVVCDTTSVNLFKLICAALAARPDRTTILSEPGNFPTDLYMAEGALGLMPGRRLRLEPAERIADAIDDDTVLVLLTHSHYKSGRLLDMAALTAAAHAGGALVLWDLSHSTGAVPVALGACDADLAVGCGYKYLNGGPGAPAFLFVAGRLQDALVSPLSGWFGHAAPFGFEDGYRPAAGIARFLCGTPSVLGMAALEQGLAQFDGVDQAALHDKARSLGGLYVRLVEQACAGHGLALASPRDDTARGAHVCFAHPDAYAICQALIARGVIGDFRAPDLLRMGFAPLATRFVDVWDAAAALASVMAEGAWRDPRFAARARVT